MDTVSIVFLTCTIILLSCTIGLSVALEIHLRFERQIVERLKMQVKKIDELMQDELKKDNV